MTALEILRIWQEARAAQSPTATRIAYELADEYARTQSKPLSGNNQEHPKCR